jgi:hypothetical protein
LQKQECNHECYKRDGIFDLQTKFFNDFNHYWGTQKELEISVERQLMTNQNCFLEKLQEGSPASSNEGTIWEFRAHCFRRSKNPVLWANLVRPFSAGSALPFVDFIDFFKLFADHCLSTFVAERCSQDPKLVLDQNQEHSDARTSAAGVMLMETPSPLLGELEKLCKFIDTLFTKCEELRLLQIYLGDKRRCPYFGELRKVLEDNVCFIFHDNKNEEEKREHLNELWVVFLRYLILDSECFKTFKRNIDEQAELFKTLVNSVNAHENDWYSDKKNKEDAFEKLHQKFADLKHEVVHEQFRFVLEMIDIVSADPHGDLVWLDLKGDALPTALAHKDGEDTLNRLLKLACAFCILSIVNIFFL